MVQLCLLPRPRRYKFPDPVIKLTEFLVACPEAWPVVADFLREVLPGSDAGTRAHKLNLLLQLYMFKPRRRMAQRLLPLLEDLYGLPCDHVDPRTMLLECVVGWAGPYQNSVRDGQGLEHAYHCTVCRIANSSQTELVPSGKALDVAFLSEAGFEGHECKTRISNFVPTFMRRCCWDAKVVGKLEFIQALAVSIRDTGRLSYMYITSLARQYSLVQKNLADNGFGDIGVLGPDEIQTVLCAILGKADSMALVERDLSEWQGG